MVDSKCGALKPPFPTSLMRIDPFTLSFPFQMKLKGILFASIIISTLINKMGLHLQIFRLSFPFFSIDVITACFGVFDNLSHSYELLIKRINKQISNRIPKCFIKFNSKAIISG